MDQHALARLELTALEEIVPDGEVILRQRACAQHVEALRRWQALRRRCGAVFGVGAAGREGAQRIAHFPSRDARAEGATVPAASRPGRSDAPGGGG